MQKRTFVYKMMGNMGCCFSPVGGRGRRRVEFDGRKNITLCEGRFFWSVVGYLCPSTAKLRVIDELPAGNSSKRDGTSIQAT
jgi:hypothetical protein